MRRCPGQDLRYWIPQDIFDVACWNCGREVEIWRDEPMRICPGCGREVRNPRIDPGCATWCKYAAECLAQPEENQAAPPLIDHLGFLLRGYLAGDPALGARARRFLGQAEKFLLTERVDPCVVQVAALLLAALAEKKAHSRDDFPIFRTMLERVGLASEVAERICELVRMVRSGGRDQSPEYRVLAELVKSEEGSGPR